MESVRRIRREKGLSQQELADKSGVGQDSISAIETGKHEPHPRTLRKLAKALDIEVADFFKELAHPLARAPETGPALLERALDAARRDEEKERQAADRARSSEIVPQSISSYEEDKFRAELRRLGFPDEHFESFIWPLIVKAAREDALEQELAALREHERAHS